MIFYFLFIHKLKYICISESFFFEFNISISILYSNTSKKFIAKFSNINIFTGDNNADKISILKILNSLKNPNTTLSWKITLRIPKNSLLLNYLFLFESFNLLFNIEYYKSIKYSYFFEKRIIGIYA